jgi:hypothetical protein
MSDFTIPGIGTVHTSPESTSTQVKEDYEKWMKMIESIFKKDESEWTSADFTQLIEALNGLQKLAQEGDPTGTGSIAYLTQDMANNLAAVMDLLAVSGITPNSKLTPDEGLIAMDTLNGWKNDKGVTFFLVVSNAVGDVQNADKNLQMMLADFVLGALNDYDKSLSSLAEELQINLRVATTLAKLQELRNKVVQAPKDTTIDPDKTPSPPSPAVTMTDEDLKNLMIYRQELRNEINDLKAKGGDTKDLEQVLNDINDQLAPGDAIWGQKNQDTGEYPYPDVTNWKDEQWANFFGSDWFLSVKEGSKDDKGNIVNNPLNWFSDNLSQAGGSAGDYQDHLQNAINTANSTNDTQKAHLQALQTTSSQITDLASALIDAIQKIIMAFATGTGKS